MGEGLHFFNHKNFFCLKIKKNKKKIKKYKIKKFKKKCKWDFFLKIFNLALAFKFSLKNFLFLATCFCEKRNIFFLFFIIKFKRFEIVGNV